MKNIIIVLFALIFVACDTSPEQSEVVKSINPETEFILDDSYVAGQQIFIKGNFQRLGKVYISKSFDGKNYTVIDSINGDNYYCDKTPLFYQPNYYKILSKDGAEISEIIKETCYSNLIFDNSNMNAGTKSGSHVFKLDSILNVDLVNELFISRIDLMISGTKEVKNPYIVINSRDGKYSNLAQIWETYTDQNGNNYIALYFSEYLPIRTNLATTITANFSFMTAANIPAMKIYATNYEQFGNSGMQEHEEYYSYTWLADPYQETSVKLVGENEEVLYNWYEGKLGEGWNNILIGKLEDDELQTCKLILKTGDNVIEEVFSPK